MFSIIFNGLANGFAECIRAGEVVYKGNFNNGLRNGVEEFRGVFTNELILLYKSHWTNGLRDGKEEVYRLPANILIGQINWQQGKKEGRERRWTNDGKTLKLDMVWSNGRQTGFDRSFYNGDQTCHYQDGQLIKCIKNQ